MAANECEKDDDTLRILVATDTHCGYNENDKIRGDDSLNTLEEILQIARARNVDLILHGGDLFHDNKPSRKCLHRVMNLLKRYSFGPGDVLFQVVSDPSLFSTGMVNYEDPNVNVDIPVFMIHGNHDDPGGESNLSVASLLEVANLVNYFGRPDDLEDIVVKPLLIRKGKTKLGLYPLGNIRDERLNRAFQNRKVRFETPSEPEQWFNVMMLHQNRHKGQAGGLLNKSCIHEQMLPQFLDLVIWGHEHDCLVSPQESLRGEFYIIQPGSSVATSLTPGETQMKHVAIIDVNQGRFKCTPVPLLSVRPLIMNELTLADSGLLKTDAQSIWNLLTAEIEAMITQGNEECRKRKAEIANRAPPTGCTQIVKTPELPLIRLRVEYTGFDTITGQSFGQQFIDRIANPDELLMFYRRKGGEGAAAGGASKKVQPIGDVLSIEEAPGSAGDTSKVQDIIYKYLEGEQSLAILPEPELNEAVQSFVHKAEPCAIERFVSDAVDATNQAVTTDSHAVQEEDIRVQMQDRTERLRQQRLAQAPLAAEPAGAPAAEMAPPAARGHLVGNEALGRSQSFQQDFPVDDQPPLAPAAASRLQMVDSQAPSQSLGRGGRGGRGRGRGRGRGAKRGSEEALAESLQHDSAFGAAPPPSKAPKSTARAVGAAGFATPMRATGVRDWLNQAAGQGAVEPQQGSQSRPAFGAAIEPMEHSIAPTSFIERRRAVAAGPEVFGGPDTGLGVTEAPASLREAVPARQWALKKS